MPAHVEPEATPVPSLEYQGMLVVRRIADGVKGHWDIRASEWLMLFPAITMGFALVVVQPDMFSTTPSFNTIARWSSESVWACWVLFCATVRLVALTVNGTFENFRFSPHMRAAASLVGIVFWSQFTLGFLNSWLDGIGSFSAVGTYSTFCLAEMLNFQRSWRDIAQGARKR